MVQNIILSAAENAEISPNINGTTMSLIIVACTLLIAVAIAIFIHFHK